VKDYQNLSTTESNTLTLIETTKGFIFGGFTPLVWDSTTNTGGKESSRPPAISTATLLPDNSVTADSAAHSANKNSD
jgi:hypothetical protein